MPPGTLFIVATPIGNLEDLTFRALRTLREVDLIAAEDTRRTAKLLAHYEIRKSMVSLHEHNEYREAPRIVERLARGENIAVVSDAGTPGIADPGARVVRAAREAGIPVVPIPGPSAITAALSVAGIDSPEFIFAGFAPAKAGTRRKWLMELAVEARTTVFFEVPHRIESCLADIDIILVKKHISLFREISKINYELVERHKNTYVKAVGEFVVVVHPAPEEAVADEKAAMAIKIFGYLTDVCDVSDDSAAIASAIAVGVEPRQSSDAIRLGRKLVKKQKMSPP